MVPMPKYGAIAITLSCRNFFGQSQNQINWSGLSLQLFLAFLIQSGWLNPTHVWMDWMRSNEDSHLDLSDKIKSGSWIQILDQIKWRLTSGWMYERWGFSASRSSSSCKSSNVDADSADDFVYDADADVADDDIHDNYYAELLMMIKMLMLMMLCKYELCPKKDEPSSTIRSSDRHCNHHNLHNYSHWSFHHHHGNLIKWVKGARFHCSQEWRAENRQRIKIMKIIKITALTTPIIIKFIITFLARPNLDIERFLRSSKPTKLLWSRCCMWLLKGFKGVVCGSWKG